MLELWLFPLVYGQRAVGDGWNAGMLECWNAEMQAGGSSAEEVGEQSRSVVDAEDDDDGDDDDR